MVMVTTMTPASMTQPGEVAAIPDRIFRGMQHQKMIVHATPAPPNK
jgi:hypothetical protein